METPVSIPPRSTKLVWAGRIISAIPVLMLLLGGFMSLSKPPQVVEGLQKFGYPEKLIVPLGIAEICCAVLYAIPQTSVIGAILMTGYLGGATATHVRIEDPHFILPVIFGIIVWLGLLFREPRLRTLLPFRSL